MMTIMSSHLFEKKKTKATSTKSHKGTKERRSKTGLNYQLFPKLNGSILVDLLLAMAASTEDANPPEP